MATRIVARLSPSSPSALGMIRAGVHGVFLVAILFTSFTNLGWLPVTILRPVGILRVLSWEVYDRLLTPAGMNTLKWLMVMSLAMSTVGYLTPITTKTSAFLVLFYQGLIRSFGHFNHDEMIAVYFLIILAFVPCGDAFAVDSWPRPTPRHRRAFVYGFPVLLMMLLLSWVYFSSGLIKLRVAGLNYFSRDNLPALAIYHSLDNLHDTHFRVAFSLPRVRDYLPFIVLLVLIWELSFPLAVFWRRARWWILGAGIVFHLSTIFLMNVFFPYHLAMYLVFVDWPTISKCLCGTRLLARPSSWWRRHRSVPEHFPETRLFGIENSRAGVFLWDGECGFCAGAVRLWQRMARQSFAEQSYQTVSDRLPREILAWADRESFWVTPEGRVFGGSAALIPLLEASGHRFFAALAGTGPVHPFLWLGYRLIADHRGALGQFLGWTTREK